MTRPAITAVVVTYQSQKTINETLIALRRSHAVGLLDCIVVDNGSTDNTLQIISQHNEWATIVDHGENVGFGRGCNIGVKQTQTPFVIFVNPDAVIEPAAVQCLLSFMQAHPQAGLAAPAIIEPNGSMQKVGYLPTPSRILRKAAPFFRPAQGQQVVNTGDLPCKTDWLCGAVLFCRTDLLQQLKGFDPRFFLYFEETDLCRRTLNLGMEIWAVGEAVAYHSGAASSVQRSSDSHFDDCIAKYYFESRFYYLCKHFGYPLAVATELGEILLLSLRVLSVSQMRRNFSRVKSRLSGPMLRSPPQVT